MKPSEVKRLRVKEEEEKVTKGKFSRRSTSKRAGGGSESKKTEENDKVETWSATKGAREGKRSCPPLSDSEDLIESDVESNIDSDDDSDDDVDREDLEIVKSVLNRAISGVIRRDKMNDYQQLREVRIDTERNYTVTTTSEH